MKKIIKTVAKILREKAEYKASRQLLKAMPADYQFVYTEIEKYMFTIMMDESVMQVLMDILESFAVASAAGRPARSLIGEDPGLFCDNLIAKLQVKTWRDIQREHLHKNINAYFNNNERLRNIR